MHYALLTTHYSLQVAPVYYVLFTLASICAAGIVNRDFSAFVPGAALGFVSSCCLCFIGVFLVTRTDTYVSGTAPGRVGDCPWTSLEESGTVPSVGIPLTAQAVSVLTTPRVAHGTAEDLVSHREKTLQLELMEA